MSYNSRAAASSTEPGIALPSKETDSEQHLGSEQKRPALPSARSRTSLSSMNDFVPATLALSEGSRANTSRTSELTGSPLPNRSSPGTTDGSRQRPIDTRAASVRSSATGVSRDSYAVGEADTVFLDRVVLGPMDLASPNRKGSQLILKASPGAAQLSVEWRQEKKVVVSLEFDALTAVQVIPGTLTCLLCILELKCSFLLAAWSWVCRPLHPAQASNGDCERRAARS